MSTLTEATVRSAVASADQWFYFSEFCRWEKVSGGPDPQLAMVAEMSSGTDLLTSGWRIGCYGAVYNVPGAELLWQALPTPILDNAEVRTWVDEHFHTIPFRRERRAVRARHKLAHYLTSYAHWLTDVVENPDEHPWPTYDSAWSDLDHGVWGAGRYIVMKMLELFHRMWGVAALAQPDMRAQGGWSPRGTLAMLWPEATTALLHDDSKTGAALAEEYATRTEARLDRDYGVQVTMYELQVLLCEYRESYMARRQYPGRSLDSELKHYAAASQHVGLGYAMFEARQKLFPVECLGEIQGWNSTRGILGHVLRDYGYTWSDTKFDFLSTSNFADPVLR